MMNAMNKLYFQTLQTGYYESKILAFPIFIFNILNFVGDHDANSTSLKWTHFPTDSPVLLINDLQHPCYSHAGFLLSSDCHSYLTVS